MQTELYWIMTPWGWLGWALFLLVTALYIYLWRSSGPRNLRKLNGQLREASKMIGLLHDEILSVNSRNQALLEKIKQLSDSQVEQRNRMMDLATVNDGLRKTVERLSLAIKDMQDRMATQHSLIVNLQTRIDKQFGS